MAYGLLLYKEIATPLGNQRLEIYKDGYSGSAVEIAGLHKDGITIGKDSQSLTQAITTSVLTIALSDCGEVDFSQFFTPNSTLFKVIWKFQEVGSSSWLVRWTGFITPDSYTENLAYRDTLTLTARDNLGRLNDYDFDLARGQMLSVRSILTQALAKAGVAMSLTVSTEKLATSPAATLAVDGLVNTTLLQGMTWHEAVNLLLTGLGMTLAWNDGNAFDLRDISQAPALSQSAFFINKSGYRQIVPALKNLTVEQNYGLRDNFYEGQFSEADCGGPATTEDLTFTPPTGHRWAMTGSFPLLNPYNGIDDPMDSIFPLVGGADNIDDYITYSQYIGETKRTVNIEFKCSNCYWKWGIRRGVLWNIAPFPDSHQSTAHLDGYTLRYRFNVFLTYGGTKYVLRETWEEYNPATIEEQYISFIMPWTREKTSMEDITIQLGSIPADGLLELVIYKPLYYLFNGSEIPLQPASPIYGRIADVVFSIGDATTGNSKRIDINAQHNVQNSIALQVGQVPLLLGSNLHFYGGLFYTDDVHTPLTVFKRNGNGTNYHLSELVGREYLSYQNAAYNALSGAMLANAAFRFDRKITFDGQSYRIVGASLAILSNTLNVQKLQQEAEFDDTEYTITTVDSNGGTIITGGGSIGPGSTPSGSDRFFEAIVEGGETVGAKALVDLSIIQEEAEPGSGSGSGTPEVTKNITEILRHLSLQVVNAGTANEQTILVTDLTFASQKNLVSGGVGGGGSTPTGGSLATLNDVTLSGLAGGDTLVYNATSSHWENKPLLLANLGDVSGTPSNGQTLVWDSISGKWMPGNMAPGGVTSIGISVPTGFAVSNSPVTSSGTIAISFASGYSLPTTHKQEHWDSAYADSHTHSNKSVLDGITSTDVSHWGTAYSDSHTHNNKSVLDGISSSAVSHWDDAYAAIGKADYNSSNAALATQTWVGNQGYLTSSAISDMATQTWVGQQGFLTSADLSGYATQSWVEGKGYVTSSAISDMATETWVNNYFLPLTGGKLTGDLRLQSGSYGQTLYFGDGAYTYISEPSDDAMTIYARNGITMLTASTGTAVYVGNSNSAIPLVVWGTLEAFGNTTIGTSSANKKLTVYGSTSAALTIYGGSSYSTNIYRDSSYLNISSSLKVSGNIVATGNVTSGTASDRRLKKDIRDITLADAEAVLARLHPVQFEWNDDAARLGRLFGVSRGFLADEYLKLLPNAGRKIWGDYDAIEYEQTIPYLVAGWQQQNLRIRILEGDMKVLKAENEHLRRRLREYVN